MIGRLLSWCHAHRRLTLLGAAVSFAMLLFLRHRVGVLDADFWAEDGWVWYPEAYTLGPASLLLPHSGYLQSFSRLAALAVQPFPLLWAPTIFALLALAVQALPPLWLLSRRMDTAWPAFGPRLLFALLYVCLPNSFETFGNVTNSQWHLAVLMFLVLVSDRRSTIVDAALLLLAGLSGPFCLFAAPVALWVWWRDRAGYRLARLMMVGSCCTLQGLLLAQTMLATRSTAPLGPSLDGLARIVAMQIGLGVFAGSHVMDRVGKMALWNETWLPDALAVGLAASVALALWRGCALLRLFALFGGLLFAAALISPVVEITGPAWLRLQHAGDGQRYYLIPMLVLAACAFSMAGHGPRSLGLVLCAGLVVGVAGDFPHPRRPRTDFNEKARLFATAPAGTRMEFGLQPARVTPMILVK